MWAEQNERDYQRATASMPPSQGRDPDNEAYQARVQEEHAKGNYLYGDIGDWGDFIKQRQRR